MGYGRPGERPNRRCPGAVKGSSVRARHLKERGNILLDGTSRGMETRRWQRNVENPWFHVVDGGDWPTTASAAAVTRSQLWCYATNRDSRSTFHRGRRHRDLPVSVVVWARCAVRSWWCWTSCRFPCWTPNWTAPVRDSRDNDAVVVVVFPVRRLPRHSRWDIGVWLAVRSRPSRRFLHLQPSLLLHNLPRLPVRIPPAPAGLVSFPTALVTVSAMSCPVTAIVMATAVSYPIAVVMVAKIVVSCPVATALRVAATAESFPAAASAKAVAAAVEASYPSVVVRVGVIMVHWRNRQ